MKSIAVPETLLFNHYEEVVLVDGYKNTCRSLYERIPTIIYPKDFEKTKQIKACIYKNIYLERLSIPYLECVLNEKNPKLFFSIGDLEYDGNNCNLECEVLLIKKDSKHFSFLYAIRNNTESAQRNSKIRKFLKGFDKIYDSCAIVDLISGEYEKLFGRKSLGNIMGKMLFDEYISKALPYIHEDDQEYFRETYSLKAIRKRLKKPNDSYETEIRDANGNWINAKEKAYFEKGHLKCFLFHQFIDGKKSEEVSQIHLQRRFVAIAKETYEKMFEISFLEDKVYDYIIRDDLIVLEDSGLTVEGYLKNCRMHHIHPDYAYLLPIVYNYENIKKTLEEGKTSITVNYPRKREDKYYWCASNIRIYVRTNRDIRAVVYIRDVDDDYKEREERIKLLEKTQQEALMANKAKTSFLANMSHDIRTPMNAIMGMTEIAKNNISNPTKINDCIEKIEKSTQLLFNLVNDVLDISQIESGKLTFKEQSIKILDSVGHVVDIVKPQSNAKKQNINVKIENIDYKQIKTDKLRLEQVLMNVLTNAIKYTPECGEIDFIVREIETNDKMNAFYEFVVKDNGIGMSEDYLAKIYEPFEREEDKSLENHGKGLGMTIVKKIIEKMNGEIKVSSQKYQGTTITIRVIMPISTYEVVEKKENDLGHETLVDKRVLVVEDIDINMEIVKELLQTEGVKVVEAWNGKEAVDILTNNENSFDLVLMDIQMPIMNGYDAAKEIRRRNIKTPILAMTANAFTKDIEQALSSGMNGHISKPIRIKDLFQAIENCI